MDATPRNNKSSTWRNFTWLLGRFRKEYVAVTLVAAAMGGVEGLIHPLLMKAIFDEAANRDDFTRLIYLVLGYLALGLVLNVGAYATSLWQQRLDNRIVQQVSADLLRAYYTKSYRDILREGAGNYVARIRSDVKDGVVPMLSMVRMVCVKLATFLALVAALLYISWEAFFVLAAIIPIATFVSVAVGKKIRGLTVVERDKEAEVLSVLTKAVGAFKIACTFGLVPKSVEAYDKGTRAVLDSGYKRFRVVRTLQGASDLTMVVSDVCSIFVGAIFVFRQQMTLGSFIAFMNAFWRSATTLIAIFKHWAELHSYGATLARVTEFMQQNPSKPYFLQSDRIIATSLSYAYDQKEVFSGFSMTLTAGSSALIVGDNGSGKTTLANVLAGYLQPTGGCLTLPRTVSSITLPLSFPPIKVDQLGANMDLLTKLNIDTPDILGAYPDELSAGQQQKLALAIALSKKADLYILDEPLANLDVRSRSIAMTEIFERTRGCMLVLIMHGSDEFHAHFDQVHLLSEKPVDLGFPEAVTVG